MHSYASFDSTRSYKLYYPLSQRSGASRACSRALVQELLGHASVAMTLDRYSHVLPKMGDQTAAAMEAALS
jgi:integrase